MYKTLSLIMMAIGVLFLSSVLLITLSGVPVVDAQADPTATYVGSDTCGDCHFAEAEQHAGHGHSYIMIPVNGGLPEYPHDIEFTPPEGYTWDDVSFVIGGFGWKARFIDQNGYIITGADANAVTEYDFPIVDPRTGDVVAEARWSAYRAGEQREFSCGGCHTSGFNHDRNTHMNELPGLVGEWAEPGVQCEECHGPGSNHVQNPTMVNMVVDGSMEACGRCHTRGEVYEIDAANGFIEDFNQYDEVQHTPHAALDCIDCHEPHRSSQYADEEVNPTRGMRTVCTDCHINQPSSAEHVEAEVTCVDCHMAPVVFGGNTVEGLHWTNMNSHLFQINTNPDAPQFNAAGDVAMPYLTLEYVCTRCHVDTPIEDLASAAQGYHDK